jgi:antirestriction protein ArdC
MASNRKDEILDALTDGIAQLTSSGRWQEWLRTQSKFHHYSFRNTLLIMIQSPDATQVAGFRAWQLLGRQVRKGEKAIWILAPVTRKVNEDTGSDGDTRDKARVLCGFKPAYVFDVAQTDGEPLPEVCSLLDGDDVAGVFERLVAVAHSIGFTVEDAEFADSRNGDCTYDLRRIRVARDRSAVQRIKTVAHELGHAMLHEHCEDRRLAELEAESVAFVVCANLGINSDDYSFGYVATWAGGGDEAIAKVTQSAGRIQHTAAAILSSFQTEQQEEVA